MDKYHQAWVRAFAPKSSAGFAITLGNVTYYSVGPEAVPDYWRAHEDCHKRQWRRLWYVGFPFVYAWQYLAGRARGLGHWDAYAQMPLEIEAQYAAAAVRGARSV